MKTNSISLIFKKIQILFILVKRDYAVQFAGSMIGISWSFIQSLSLIFIYSLVFFVLNKIDSRKEEIAFLFSGLLFWIPIQDMIIKNTSILSENRNLIKKSNLGLDLFLLIPFVQMLIQFFILSIPIFFILIYLNELNFVLFLFSYFWILFVGVLVFFISNYLACLNILLKDLTPIIRLISIFLFWSLPILYKPTGILEKISYINPFLSLLEIFRFFCLGKNVSEFNLILLIYPISFSILVYVLTKKKLSKIILDHL